MNYQKRKLTAADALEAYDLTALQSSKRDNADSDKNVCIKVQKSPDTLQQCWQQLYNDCARYSISATNMHAKSIAFCTEPPRY